jgi:hypothetical protein
MFMAEEKVEASMDLIGMIIICAILKLPNIEKHTKLGTDSLFPIFINREWGVCP